MIKLDDGNFFYIAHAVAPYPWAWTKNFVTRTLTHDPFAVANLVHIGATCRLTLVYLTVLLDVLFMRVLSRRS